MMALLTYVIQGDPIALNRARVGRNTCKMFDPQKQIKLLIGIELQRQHGERPLYTGPLKFDITFFMRLSNQLKKKPPYYHIFKPDSSNMIKMYEDVCTGILYHDDCLIAAISAQKVYDLNPRVEFTITELR